MDKFERKIVSGYLKFRKRYVAKLTPKSQIENLIHSIRPVAGNAELIRVGDKIDGGYLIPNDLKKLTACFSPGVGNETSFEQDCIRHGMDVYLSDASVDKPQYLPENCFFQQNFIGSHSSGKFITLDSWVKSTQVGPDDELILQMDIEGAEYEVLLSLSEDLLKRFRIIVFEVHQLDQWWNAPFFNLVNSAFTKLNQTHVCVHNHPNTLGGVLDFNGLILPKRIELSFHRRDRATNHTIRTNFPHPLDCDNSAGHPLSLPPHWYQ